MPEPSDRLRLIRQVAGVMRRNSADFNPVELELAASEIEREAELALAELEVGTPAPMADFPAEASRLLSAREIEVLRLVSNGLPDKQIAQRLGISTFTVNKHVGAILVKMEASSRTEASVRAIMEGFLHPRAS